MEGRQGGQGPQGGGTGTVPYSPNPTVTVDYNLTGNDGTSKGTRPTPAQYHGQQGGGSGGSPPTYNSTWWKPYLGPGAVLLNTLMDLITLTVFIKELQEHYMVVVDRVVLVLQVAPTSNQGSLVETEEMVELL